MEIIWIFKVFVGNYEYSWINLSKKIRERPQQFSKNKETKISKPLPLLIFNFGKSRAHHKKFKFPKTWKSFRQNFKCQDNSWFSVKCKCKSRPRILITSHKKYKWSKSIKNNIFFKAKSGKKSDDKTTENKNDKKEVSFHFYSHFLSAILGTRMKIAENRMLGLFNYFTRICAHFLCEFHNYYSLNRWRRNEINLETWWNLSKNIMIENFPLIFQRVSHQIFTVSSIISHWCAEKNSWGEMMQSSQNDGHYVNEHGLSSLGLL